MSPVSGLLADDHALVRAGIRALVNQIHGVRVIAEADDGETALKLIQEHQPDIALLDIAMPGLTGLEVTAQVVQRFPNVRVIMLSMHADQEHVLQAIRSGACGYLLKGARTPELELAINSVARGETYLSPGASKHVVGDMLQRGAKTSPLDQLTPRQRQVLQLIAEGFSRKEIALKFNVSAKTVDTYRAQLMDQLNIHDVPGLVRFALKAGLIQMDSTDPKMHVSS